MYAITCSMLLVTLQRYLGDLPRDIRSQHVPRAREIQASTLPRRIAEGHFLGRDGPVVLPHASTLPRRIAEGHLERLVASDGLRRASTLPRKIAEGHHGRLRRAASHRLASTLPRRIAEGHFQGQARAPGRGDASTLPRRIAEGHTASTALPAYSASSFNVTSANCRGTYPGHQPLCEGALRASTLPRRIAEGHTASTCASSTTSARFNVTSANCRGTYRRKGEDHSRRGASTLPRRIAEGHVQSLVSDPLKVVELQRYLGELPRDIAPRLRVDVAPISRTVSRGSPTWASDSPIATLPTVNPLIPLRHRFREPPRMRTPAG